MKKITSLLIAVVMLLSLWSCGTEPTPASSADSASGEFAVTKDMIAEIITKMRDEVTSPEGELPFFMSYTKVQEGVNQGDLSFETPFFEYEDKVEEKLEELVSKLPERCTLYHCPVWVENFPLEDSYIILDPQNVPMDTKELVLYLECEYHEADTGREYDEYYPGMDMAALEEKYADIGTVVVDTGSFWYYLDTKSNTLEIIEYFPDHEAILRESFKAFSNELEKDAPVSIPEN